MKINGGGPAFPSSATGMNPVSHHGASVTTVYPGMTLRDYFAAKAMAAYLSTPEVARNIAREDMSEAEVDFAIATEAYAMADAMLKARDAA